MGESLSEMTSKTVLPGTGLRISPIVFGLWGLAGPPFWKNVPEKEAVSLLRKAFESGINFFDTAPVYGMGRGEELLRKAFPPGKNSELFIATKTGLRWKENKIESIYHDLSAQSIRTEVEESLRRLGRDYVDLYQVHWPDPNTPMEETFTELSKLKEEGKIRFIGVCNYTVEMLMRAEKIVRISTVQNRFNLLDRKMAASLLPYCRKNKIGTLVYSPLASGMLTGRYNLESHTGDWRDREFSDLFKKDKRRKALEIIEKLKKVPEQEELTVSQLALLWTLLQPGVSASIVGIRSVLHLREAAELMKKLPSESFISGTAARLSGL